MEVSITSRSPNKRVSSQTNAGYSSSVYQNPKRTKPRRTEQDITLSPNQKVATATTKPKTSRAQAKDQKQNQTHLLLRSTPKNYHPLNPHRTHFRTSLPPSYNSTPPNQNLTKWLLSRTRTQLRTVLP